MQTHVKRWIQLAAGAAATGAFLGWIAVLASERQEATPPWLAPEPERHAANHHAGHALPEPTTRAPSPARTASAATLATGENSPWSESAFLASLESPAALAQLVQAALSGNETGLATRAAVAIGGCFAMDALDGLPERIHSAEVQALMSRELELAMQAWRDNERRRCQALDAFSRTQWLPLLRRGLAEGRMGDANDLLLAFMVGPHSEQVMSEVFPYLRRDAFRCDESALASLHGWEWPSDNSLTRNEAVAVWQVLKSLYEAKSDDWWHKRASELTPPIQAGDPAEVQRIGKAIRSNC
ncbi:hypothetical protein [Rubrivivax rivuli]|uniref:Uncharacterized protein n=1 Tax=Rubrivivax rivuli TaxID=1862385 RepID=A0A437RAI7_9BURK|nr:hypothetical protein [Rubrivivax rivuli]RVU43791.1 hypothetical protein EOE66_19155 [Rubrivivax rivuli]